MSSEALPSSTKLFFREAIARALREEMSRDERVIVLGQDVADFGGSYREFVGLYETFGPARVRNTPVAESAMIGIGVGAAAAGLRPLVSITYMDFLMLGLDPLVNYGAKARYKTGGQIEVPLVVKTTAGAKGQGVAHSQCIESWLMAVPGLKVVAPATAGDAYGLLKSALGERGPVVYVDHKRLFPTAGEVPAEETPVPIGKAAIRRRGNDVTIATFSFMTRIAEQSAERLAAEGIACEIVDLRSLAPLDMVTVCESAGRTGALLTLEEGQLTCGVGAEVIFRARESLANLRTARVGALPAPVSSNPVLEAACIPDAERVTDAVRRLLVER
ncbi:MAG TPA: transketolase C-terminal domain-containing protein [Stellaceae bacterium]|nr:transketolase C-terminal domain-containing protein [Stellaceae bacterium]